VELAPHLRALITAAGRGTTEAAGRRQIARPLLLHETTHHQKKQGQEGAARLVGLVGLVGFGFLAWLSSIPPALYRAVQLGFSLAFFAPVRPSSGLSSAVGEGKEGGSGWAGQWRRNGWGFIRGRKGGGRGRPRRVTLQETVCGLRSAVLFHFFRFFFFLQQIIEEKVSAQVYLPGLVEAHI
jgi:hypothetical protein